MTSLRTARTTDGVADLAIRSWIGSLVAAQTRLRDVRHGVEPLLEEFVRSVCALVDAPARVCLAEAGVFVWRAASTASAAPAVGRRVDPLADPEGAAVAEASHTLRPVRLPDRTPLVDHVADPRTERLSDPLTDPIPGPLTDALTGLLSTAGADRGDVLDLDSLADHDAARAVLAVPLVHGDSCLGVIVLTAAVPDWFDETDEQAVVLLAGTAAAGLAAASLPLTQPLSLAELREELRKHVEGGVVDVGRHRAPGPEDVLPGAQEPWTPPAQRPHDAGDVTAWSSGSGLLADTPELPTGSHASAADAGTFAGGMLDVGGLWHGDSGADGLAARMLAGGLPDLLADQAARHAAPRFDTAVPITPTLPTIGSLPTPAGLGLWEWDAETGQVTWSEPVAKLLGLPASGTVELDMIRHMLPEDEQRRFDETVTLVQEGEGAAGSFRVVLSDGEPRRFYAWGEARRDLDGSLVGAWGALVDVTEREQDAAVLRNSLAGLRAAQELTGLGVWEWHPEADRLVWSPEMYRIVGLEPGELEPTLDVWHGFVHPEDVDRVRRLDILAADRDGGAVENFRIIGADGVVRHVQSWSTVVAAVDGSPRAVCGATVDVTGQVHDRDLLEQLSATDAVTGLGNRLAFDKAMTELLADPSRDVAVLLLDLDRFKTVNDSLGHAVGDRLLVEAARRLTAVAPEGSITARMGGDEFVVVPRPGLGWLQVRRLAQAVVDALRAPYVLPESGEMLVCPASVGVTSTSGRTVDVSDLLREADLALYRAKDSGRDRYVVFDDVLRARAQARHLAERQLRQALEEHRLELEYQPIVDLDSGEVVGAEALVRLREAGDGRLLGPEEFIDVAEDTGLIVEVDCWVIEQAMQELQRWDDLAPSRPHPGARLPWLAINVSARSMEHPKVSRRLLEGLRSGRVSTDQIKVELTEHSFLGALPGGESYLRRLMSSGVPVGIDDFGTGYSALAYLQRFELDFMKIDRSFVASVGKDERSDAVVTAIVDLAHAHGMRVTAEGVETDAQAARLQEIGCDFAQGFHFGAPGPSARILGLA